MKYRSVLGTPGGYERVILQVGGNPGFYLSLKFFGRRIRLYTNKPYFFYGRA